MPATILVAAEERPILGFVLSRVAEFYQQGTMEQRESAASIRHVLRGLESAPGGDGELELLTQDAYVIGVRLFATSVELKDYWLDERARTEGVDLPARDAVLAASVQHFLPALAINPETWEFESVQGIFSDLGFRFDKAVTEAAPRSRAIYNSEREGMTEKAMEIQEVRAAQREARAFAEVAAARAEAASVTRARPVGYQWGVDVATGLTSDDIPLNSFRPLTIGSVHLLITNFGGQLGAVSGRCSHQSQSLDGGRLHDSLIVCPRHGAEFDLRTGKEHCPPFCDEWMNANGMKAQVLKLLTPDKAGGDLQTFPLRLEGGEIILHV